MTDERFERIDARRGEDVSHSAEARLRRDVGRASIRSVGAAIARHERAVRTAPRDARLPRRAAHAGSPRRSIVGVGLGRASHAARPRDAPAVASAGRRRGAPASHADTGVARPYELETSQYLGQTAALLVALPAEVKAGRADQQFTARAADLLTRTRLLMDSPAANDPAMRSLLDDLELVLAQVVRLQNNGNRTELDLINRALEQRDVIPRLRTAVADISAN